MREEDTGKTTAPKCRETNWRIQGVMAHRSEDSQAETARGHSANVGKPGL